MRQTSPTTHHLVTSFPHGGPTSPAGIYIGTSPAGVEWIAYERDISRDPGLVARMRGRLARLWATARARGAC